MKVQVVKRRLSDDSFVYDVLIEQGIGGNSVVLNMESQETAEQVADLLNACCVDFEII